MGIRAVQSMPLFSPSGALIGVLSTHWREPRTLNPGAVATLEILARHAADLMRS